MLARTRVAVTLILALFPSAGAAQTGAIAGRVTDSATGAPLVGITISIQSTTSSSSVGATTDAAGSYTATGLAPGTYTALAYSTRHLQKLFPYISCPATGCDRLKGQSIAVQAGATTGQIDFALDEGGVISGSVVDAMTGAPVTRGTVSVFDANGTGVSAATIDASGGFVAARLPRGLHYVLVQGNRDDGYVQQIYPDVVCTSICRLTDGTAIRVQLRQTVQISARLQRRGSVRGRVVDAVTNAPLAGVKLQVEGADAVSFPYIESDATGFYTIPNLTPGLVHVRTAGVPAGYIQEAYGGVPLPCADFSSCSSSGVGLPVTVVGGQITGGVDFALKQGGQITGRVTDAATGVALTKVLVRVFTAYGVLIRSATPDASGQYRLIGLASGRYFLRASSDNFPISHIASLYGGAQCPWDSCSIFDATPVEVTAGSVTGGIDFALDPGATITGTVRASATGQPVTFVSVYLQNARGAARFSSSTGSSGVFTMQAVPAGSYVLRTVTTRYVDEWHDGTCAACGSGTPLVVPARAAISGVDFSLDEGGRITGAITVPSPLATIINPLLVTAYDARGKEVASVAPQSTGSLTATYELTGLATGSYFVKLTDTPSYRMVGYFGGTFVDELYPNVACVEQACDVTAGTPVPVTAGAVTANIDFSMEAGATIEGLATVDDLAVRGGFIGGLPLQAGFLHVSVTAYTPQGKPVASSIGCVLFLPCTPYVIRGLAPGTYYLRATAGDHAPQIYKDLTCATCSVTAGRPVTVTGGERKEGIDFRLLPAGGIRGTVRDAVTGGPLVGVRIDVLARDGSLVTFATTDGAGAYSSASLAAGSYFVRTIQDRDYLDEMYNDIVCEGCSPAIGSLVTVTAGRVTEGIDFALVRGGTLRGTVADTGGVTIPSVPVAVVASDGTVAASATSDVLGVYRARVRAGTFTATAGPTDGYAVQLYNGQACPNGVCPGTGTPIVVTAGSTVSAIDFSLSACGVLTLSPSTLPNGTVGVPYSQTLSSTGGSGSSRFAIVDGLLPSGLTLNATSGVLSGTPAASGHSVFVVAAVDANGCSARRSYTIEVNVCAVSVSPVTLAFGSASGTQDVTVASSCSLDVVASVPWISVAPTSGRVTVTVAANTGQGLNRSGTITIGNRIVTVTQAPADSTSPFGFVDTPSDGATVSGSIAVAGWALDDLLVTRVRLLRDPVAGEAGLVFIGEAVFVNGARPDVEAAFPDAPQNRRGGWGYLLLTNMLPNQGNGTFRLWVYASDAEGHETLLGTRTITAANATATAPFGAIDTPGQGETIRGSGYIHFGWAVTPRPRTIPTDGSTIQVYIDGTVIGTVTYNNFRSDVAALFPGLNNTNGAVGYRVLNTTTLTDGLHTIAWIVTDDGGGAAGIGSRYFTVDNAGTSAVTASVESEARHDHAQAHRVDARASDRILIDLTPAVRVASGCAVRFEGFEAVGSERRTLPVGSTLDAERGTFAWVPGPAFRGTYHFVFEAKDCDGRTQTIDVDVTIRD